MPQITNTPCESHSLPYYGVLGSLKDQKGAFRIQVQEKDPNEDKWSSQTQLNIHFMCLLLVIDTGPTPDPKESYPLPHIGFEHRKDTQAQTDKEGVLSWNQKKHNETVLTLRSNCWVSFLWLCSSYRVSFFFFWEFIFWFEDVSRKSIGRHVPH